MGAVFQENIDGSYSLHFQETELEVLTVLLNHIQFGNEPHPTAAYNMLIAIESVISADHIDNICQAIPLEIEYGDDEDEWSLKIG